MNLDLKKRTFHHLLKSIFRIIRSKNLSLTSKKRLLVHCEKLPKFTF